MPPSSTEHRYTTGYNTGRTLCIQTSLPEAGRRWAEAHQQADEAR